jgi:hypothetical protein
LGEKRLTNYLRSLENNLEDFLMQREEETGELARINGWDRQEGGERHMSESGDIQIQ